MDDTATTVLIVVLALAVLAAVALLLWRRRRSAGLRDRFGPEYERTLSEADSRRTAERDLRERAERRERLDIRPLDPVRREAFTDRWWQVQQDFVDRPADAVTEAQALVTEVMRERGYPVDDAGEQMRVLSVDHADVMDTYREAHGISQLNAAEQATTEQLRQAMVHYRSLLGRLLGTDGAVEGRQPRGDGDSRPDATPPPEDTAR